MQDSLRLCRGRFRKRSRTQMIRKRPQGRNQRLTRTSFSLRLCRRRFRKKSRTQMIRQRPQRRSQGLTRTSSLLSLPNPNPTPRILFFSLLRSPQEIIAKKNSIRLLTSTSIPKLPAKDHKSTVAHRHSQAIHQTRSIFEAPFLKQLHVSAD